MYIDRFLIGFFRIGEIPILGYLLGAAILSLICVVLGQFTLSLAYRANRMNLKSNNNEMVRMHNLSIYALLAKNKKAYKSCNKEANDAFGKYFFAQIALGISSLWPIPFALAWMQTRFDGVDFLLPFYVPGVGHTVGYTFTFIPIYVLVYILFSNIKHRLPYFKKEHAFLKADVNDSEKMLSISDLHA
jgi:hypothetical protein